MIWQSRTEYIYVVELGKWYSSAMIIHEGRELEGIEYPNKLY